MLPEITGLRYLPEYLDAETHCRLLAAVDLQPWQTSVDHGVQVYGFHYNHAERAAYRIGELPQWAGNLAECLYRDGLVPSVPNQLVANEYQPGTGIFTHIDQSVFGETIASISLGSACVMQFAQCESGRMEELLVEPRSALVLSEEARWKWTHGILARTVDTWQNQNIPRSRRVSLTFRIVPPETVRDQPPYRSRSQSSTNRKLVGRDRT